MHGKHWTQIQSKIRFGPWTWKVWEQIISYVDLLVDRIEKVENLEPQVGKKSESAVNTNKKNSSSTLNDPGRTILAT